MSDYAIIGGSAAGISAAEAIRKTDRTGSIILISDERAALYSRCLLTYYIGGKLGRDKLLFKDKDFYTINSIEALHGARAQALDIKKKEISISGGKKVSYGKLLIATGGSPKKTGIKGEDKKGVFSLRTMEDAEGIVSTLDKTEQAVILGGGLIGLRDAYALRLKGKKVKVIVKSPYILSQMLDKVAADIIEKRLADEGIEFMKGRDAKEITGSGSVSGVKLDNGEEIPCGLVIVGKGVSPNIGLAKGASISTAEGIVVGESLETSSKDIYAAGDVAEAMDLTAGAKRINAVWPVAVEQGRIAGSNMAGGKASYEGSGMMNATDFFGLPVIALGVTKTKEPGYEELTRQYKDGLSYRKIVIKDNVIRGAIFVNSVRNAGVYGILMKKQIDISRIKERLISDDLDYAKILPLVKEFPDKFTGAEFRETSMTL